jgi:adenylate cyclase
MGIFSNIFHNEESGIALEIERKFLVKGDFKSDSTGKFEIKQGYLSIDPARIVRIRIADDKGFITIKGESDQTGTTRMEWEQMIPHAQAEELLGLCLPHTIEKTRYIVEMEDLIFEVDEFHGANEGLVIAEIELTDVNDEIPLPEWLGKEVTNDKRYYNAYLSQQPYSSWKEKL